MQPGTSPTWQVTSQQEVMEPDQSGNIVRGVRVYFTTSTGASGSVFVPATVYGNVDSVRAMLQAQVDATSAVAGLNG